ncbi:MAG TPA: DUF4214 domain-containing protein [Pirellulales bacterium]|nr:DUF4214 domain-containing protein [Pirellulales bacterium]
MAWLRRLGRSAHRSADRSRLPKSAKSSQFRPLVEWLESRRLLAVTASINAAGALQVQISGTDTATIGENSDHTVFVTDSSGSPVFAGPPASSITGILVTPGGVNDVVDLTRVGSSSDFTSLVDVDVGAGTGADTRLAGTLSTSGDQTYSTAVTLTGTTNVTAGGKLTFGSTVDGASQLVADGASTTFLGAVGGTSALTNFEVDGTTADMNGGLVHTTGAQFYDAPVVLTANTTVISDSDSIDFASTVDGPFSLSTTSRIVTTFDGPVGGTTPLTSLAAGGAGLTDLRTSISTVGAQTYGQAVSLGANATLDTQGGNVTFTATVDDNPDVSPHAGLTIDTTGGRTTAPLGQTQFEADVGANRPLASLTVTTGGPLILSHTIVTNGNQSLTVVAPTPSGSGGDLTVASGGSLVSTSGTIRLSAGDNLTIAAGSSIAASNVTLQGDFGNGNTTAATTVLLAGAIQSPQITVSVGNGKNTINVVTTLAGTTTTINGGGGATTFNLSSDAPGRDGTLSGIAGAVAIHGGSGINTLVIGDGADSTGGTGTLTSTSITGLGMANGVTYSGLQNIIFQLPSGTGPSLTIPSTPGGTAVTANGGSSVNVGGGVGGLDPILGSLIINGAAAVNVDDQQATSAQTYDISSGFVVRSGTSDTPHQVGISVSSVGTLAVNGGTQDDIFNVFLPLTSGQTILVDGGGGPYNEFHVVGSNAAPNAAVIGNFGSGDALQIRNIQCIAMYGAADQTNFFVNQTAISSILIGGMENDTLVGGSGPDVLFGGAGNDVLIAGGTAGSPGTDYTFADMLPAYLSNGMLNTNVGDTTAYPPQSGTKVIDGGGGVIVYFNTGTAAFNASSVTFIECDLPGSRALLQSIFDQALAAHPVCLGMLESPPTPPSSVTTQAVLVNYTPYVEQAFQSILDRPVDSTALNYWTGQLTGGLSRAAFASALTHSDEYYRRLVASAYEELLGRAADPTGIGFWVGQFDLGMTDQQFDALLTGSTEYYDRAGSDSAWIDAMYRDLLGRPADAQGQTYWLAQLQSGVSRTVIASQIAQTSEAEGLIIANDYQHYLNRSPAPAETSYWVGQLATGLTYEDVIAALVGSQEYLSAI